MNSIIWTLITFNLVSLGLTEPVLNHRTRLPVVSKLSDEYAAFVETVNTNFIDSQFNNITLNTTNHPPIDSLIKQTDARSKIVYPNLPEASGQAGIGINFVVRNNFPFIISLIDDGPAFRSGILPHDTIIEIDGQETKNISIDSVAFLLKGEAGTLVRLKTRRVSESSHLFQINREIVVQKSISKSCVLDSQIGYVKIVFFQEDVKNELEKSCDSLFALGCKLIILDVRNNHGGKLLSTVDCSGLFLPKRTLICRIKQIRSRGDEILFSTSGKFTKQPLVVLVNSYTCSGAEIFALSLKENKRACLIGSRTAGLGSVQSLLTMNKTYSMMLTTGYFITSQGKSIEKVGVLPDSLIEEPKDFREIHVSNICNCHNVETPDNQLTGAIHLAREIIRTK